MLVPRSLPKELYIKLLHLYVENTELEIDQIFQLYDDKNYDKVKDLAHKIKGSSATVGATIVSSVALSIEEAIKSENFQVEKELQELKNQFFLLKEYLDANYFS